MILAGRITNEHHDIPSKLYCVSTWFQRSLVNLWPSARRRRPAGNLTEGSRHSGVATVTLNTCVPRHASLLFIILPIVSSSGNFLSLNLQNCSPMNFYTLFGHQIRVYYIDSTRSIREKYSRNEAFSPAASASPKVCLDAY